MSCWLYGLIAIFVLFCLAVGKLPAVAVPVDYLLRIVKIKILLLEHSGKEIRYILCTHAKPKTQKKNRLSLHRSLGQPVIHQCRKLGRSRVHGLGRISFLKGFHRNIPVYLLGHFPVRLLKACTLINISLQMISKGNQLHLLVEIMEDHFCIFIFKALQAHHLPEPLRRPSGKFKIFHCVKCHSLFEIKILHTIFHNTSPSFSFLFWRSQALSG